MLKQLIHPEIILTPAQQRAYDWLVAALPSAGVLVLQGRPGSGKTTILRKLHASHGGILLGMRQFMESLRAYQPFSVEDAFLRMIEQALEAHDLVMVDDLHLVTRIVSGCDYPTTYLLDAALTALLAEAVAARKKLVFSLDGDPPFPIKRRAYSQTIGEYAPEDYECIRARLPGEAAVGLDYSRIQRFASFRLSTRSRS